ncbi:phosphatidylinositol-3-phosphate-binding ubiquitin-protein ligase [Aspergillus undulatus]|uniref:phosphatidylinositol-3-phosphate-binding ubiquitin-protein ligase n=1 Tax=Aspergillus undulatus TaxID=1810928 RepID=UPI003CCE2EB2
MSSLSRSASSTSGPPTTTPASTGLRLHASSDSLNSRTREAGPAYDPRTGTGRRRSTLAGPDRKRRYVHPDIPGEPSSGSSYARPLGIGSSTRVEMDSRSILNTNISHPQPTATALPGSSYETAIDLSSSPEEVVPAPPPQLPQRRQSSWSSHSQYGEQNRPSWQPDAEVTECPICRTAFSFWYRKHHCRKCGRVVCSSCSPHRITIPRQYIVHPPTSDHSGASAIAQRATQIVNLECDDSTQSPVAANPALGGGEEVRLCNPCVPDPNPEPPAGYPPVRTPGEIGSGPGWTRHRSYHSMSTPSRQHPYASIPETFTNFTSRPSRRTVGSSDYPGFTGFGGQYTPSFQGRPLSYGSSSSRLPPLNPSSRHTFHYPRPGPSDVPPVIPEPSSRPRAMHGSSQSSRHIDECDLCPICDNELPALGPNGNEDAREAHIRDCIANHGRSSGGSPVSQPHFPVRMLAFTATEKDCMSQDGTEQECTICMEEYEVGQSLVRLECLCKFHKRCIVEWFERKKECPVHKTS